MSAERAGTSRQDIFHPERVRNLDTDAALGLDPWRPLHEACICLCVQTPKTDAELQRLAKLWNGRRDVEVRLLGYATQDFEFLRHFPGLERLHVESPTIRNIEGLRHVAETLREFALANTTVQLSLRPLTSCTRLESLHLQRQKKDFAALRGLERLHYLGLSGASLPDLSALLPYKNLRSLFLGFSKPLDLGLLGRFEQLESLHLIKINNLSDVSALELGRGLRRIELEWLPHVATLPDLSGLTRLEEVEISTMKALRDVASIARAPALRFLGLWDCPSLTPESFQCLIGHPTLEHLNFGIGSLKGNDKVAAMFPEEMTQPVSYRITPGSYLRRPTS
jgi:internalin A